ncbi:MAG: hypothetical protein K0R39_639 [Symbiobacteriaceae bacterium]|nr:hypothetical protein [Symbiobacteriaceae bacterium]
MVDSLSGYARPLPDGPLVLQTLDAGEQRQFLINLATGERVPIKTSDSLRWTEGGGIYMVTRP